MCGIAGIVETGGGSPARDVLERMTRRLAHRGPDGEGVVVDGPAGFGHRRLAILDLSPAGAQPMASADGARWLTYNGEVYNYLELAADLAARGAIFRSRSDTEVLLHAHAAHGDAFLRHLNGMFAFALWDRPRRRLLCARDRFGVKPFFYYFAEGRFTFASEVKALLECPWVPRRPNLRVLRAYLATGAVDAGDETFFEGILRLPPAHRLLLEEGRLRLERWWDLAPGEDDPRRPSSAAEDRAAADRFASLFEDAVRLRLRSDVPVGTCLSGGLDSSSIACEATRLLRQGSGAGPAPAPRLRTFTADFQDEELRETPYWRAVVDATGAEAHTVTPSGAELLQALPKLLFHQEEPFVSTSVFAQWRVAQSAREHGVPVLLDGQGADEVLAGYGEYAGPHVLDLCLSGHWERLGPAAAGVRAAWGDSLPGLVRRVLRELVPPAARRRAGRAGAPPSWYLGETPEPRPARNPMAGFLPRALYRSLTRTSLPGLLRYEDRNTMAFGVEARLPFLDYRLVELAFALPNDQKLRGAWTKFVLRQALAPVLPAPVRERIRKLGFATPEARWLREDLAPLVLDLLGSRSLAERGFVDVAAARADYEAFRAGRPADTQKLWRWINAELWFRTWWP
ncbi:MAG: asparagine synthase (glutamine-hydrolyzing) [Planctomycetes bacterium]|nr:asparagine synthase (glutamine-hydrolyzing) [Planctomycetota bacterium]